MATPYDGLISFWHWQGKAVGEQTIDEVIATIKGWAPNARGVWVKTSNGTVWQGVYDTKPDIAINGPDDIARWVSKLESNGMQFHAWCVPKGRTETLEREAELIIQACLVPGVRSMILDIEPYQYFWEGPKENVRKLMEMVRRRVPGSFHIGMSMDPRPHHKQSIYPDEWMPFIDSLHPQCYWRTFQRPVDEVLREAYKTWGGYGQEIGREIPIIPALQGAAVPDDIERAVRLVTEEFGATGVSYWRFGVIGAAQFPAINKALPTTPPAEGTGDTSAAIGATVVVKPEDAAYADGVHSARPIDEVWMVSRNKFGWLMKSTDSEDIRSEVWARWDPRLPKPGRYEVSVFVPDRHATTTRARYKIHGVVGRPGETVAEVNQSRYTDLWVSLGVFDFDPVADPTAGVIFLNDLTGEKGREVAFDAIRWRLLLTPPPGARYVADGYDSPVGTPAERATIQVWPGHWVDATGFGTRYRIGTPDEAYHTGVDLNLNKPHWDADAGAPVYAVASGEVTFVGDLAGWGKIIITRHDPLITNRAVLYSRSAHVENALVSKGDRVQRGEQIAQIGNAGGLYPYHLHFDLSPTDVLNQRPGHWPRLNMAELKEHYIDPRAFISKNRPPR
mgnify:CR=1 FL=1